MSEQKKPERDNLPLRIQKEQVINGKSFVTNWIKTKRPYDGEIELEDRDYLGYCWPFDPKTYSPAPGIICDQDVAVTMRDGVKIYADIYRPDTTEKVPVLVSWSHFGKHPVEGKAFLSHLGVPKGTSSWMCKFESPDPGFWCHQGYAIANVDPRGTGYSEGDMLRYGDKDSEDGYDFIEWIAEQPWCNGKVGMAGNSQVAVYQWFIAATQPPHLAAIAPWEATCDKFREQQYEGGVPASDFSSWITSGFVGLSYSEDMRSNVEMYPFMNEYWEDKAAKLEKIRIPCYITASWSHFHMHGSFQGFRRVRTSRKWIRVHREFEWPDAFDSAHMQDLKRFFDRYLKDIHNGWETTPRVRLQVMDAFDCDYQTDRPENEFPLARTQYTKYYLNASNMSLSTEKPVNESLVRYDAETGVAEFDMVFNEETELTGYAKLHLWVEAEGHDEMDLFINVQKVSSTGDLLPTWVLGENHPGQWGKLRVSRRELDPERSTDFEPVLLQKREQKLEPGKIYPVDISIWPSSKIWHKGQRLRVQISGRYIRDPGWFEPLGWNADNKGTHIIHTGGQYDSYFYAPVIPPKYRDGDYVYR